MKPPQFRYARPGTLEAALSLLEEEGDEARVLAGGQSLVPLMNMRLARPSVVIDLGSIPELSVMGTHNGVWQLGAMVTQRTAELSSRLVEDCPLLGKAFPYIGHLQIRTLGTVGGSIAHADPAAELPAVALTLDAELTVRSTSGERTIRAQEFFQGPYVNALHPGEILTQINLPAHPQSRSAFQEFVRRKGDFAVTGISATADMEDDKSTVARIRLGAFGVSGSPVRLPDAETVVAGRTLTSDVIGDASEAAAAEVDPWDDIHGSAGYRRKLVAHLVGRALQEVAV